MTEKNTNESAVLAQFSLMLYKICQESKGKDVLKKNIEVLYNRFFANNKIGFDEVFLFLKVYCSDTELLPETLKIHFDYELSEMKEFCSQSKRMSSILNEFILCLIKDAKGKRYITTEAVGTILSANHQMVLGLIHSGKLPAYKLNNQYRVLYDDVILFIEENKYFSKGGTQEKKGQKFISRENVVSSQTKSNEANVIPIENAHETKEAIQEEGSEKLRERPSDIIVNSNTPDKGVEMGVSLANMIQTTKKKEKIAIEL